LKKSWSELAVANVWPHVKENTLLKKYLPHDEMEEGRFPDRDWFWKILCTVLPKYS